MPNSKPNEVSNGKCNASNCIGLVSSRSGTNRRTHTKCAHELFDIFEIKKKKPKKKILIFLSIIYVYVLVILFYNIIKMSFRADTGVLTFVWSVVVMLMCGGMRQKKEKKLRKIISTTTWIEERKLQEKIGTQTEHTTSNTDILAESFAWSPRMPKEKTEIVLFMRFQSSTRVCDGRRRDD